MKLLLDQDIYAVTTRFLKDLDHDVVTASDLGLSQADDEYLLKVAQEQKRVFITRDRDFGNLVFVHKLGAGVIYIIMVPSTLNSVHHELENVLRKYSLEEHSNAFIVVESSGHRIRWISN